MLQFDFYRRVIDPETVLGKFPVRHVDMGTVVSKGSCATRERAEVVEMAWKIAPTYYTDIVELCGIDVESCGLPCKKGGFKFGLPEILVWHHSLLLCWVAEAVMYRLIYKRTRFFEEPLFVVICWMFSCSGCCLNGIIYSQDTGPGAGIELWVSTKAISTRSDCRS